MTAFTGTIPTIASGDTTTVPTNLAVYRDALKAESEAWTSYTPAWTASSVNPVIGNGTIVGAYQQVNKKVAFSVVITMGSTTTYGTGTYIVTIPVAAHGRFVANVGLSGCSGTAFLGAQSFPIAVNRYTSSTTIYFGGPTGAALAPAVPFTWANGAILSFGGTYEAA